MVSSIPPFFIIFVVVMLNVMDIVTTYYGLTLGLKELNPIYKHEYSILKVVLPIISLLVYQLLIKGISETQQAKLTFVFNFVWIIVILIYLVVVLRNIWLIFRVWENGFLSS